MDYPITTSLGTYHHPPMPTPGGVSHIRGRRHGDMCCACPFESQCREAVAQGQPVRCERPGERELEMAEEIRRVREAQDGADS